MGAHGRSWLRGLQAGRARSRRAGGAGSARYWLPLSEWWTSPSRPASWRAHTASSGASRARVARRVVATLRADDHAAARVDAQRDVAEPRPRSPHSAGPRPQAVRRASGEVTPHQVGRAASRLRRRAVRRLLPPTTHACRAPPRGGRPGHGRSGCLAARLPPAPLSPVDLEVGPVDPGDLDRALGVAQRTRRRRRRLGGVGGGRGDLQHAAARPRPRTGPGGRR